MTTRGSPRDRKGAVYRRVTAEARNRPGPCILCGRPIDRTLPKTDAASVTAEHVTPITQGGDRLGPMGPAHRVCNMRRHNKPITPDLLAYIRTAPLAWDTSRPTTTPTPLHSQDW